MNKAEALEELTLLEARTAALRRIIEAPDKLPGLWAPEYDSTFYMVRPFDGVVRVSHCGSGDEYRKMGNCFPSREIAEKAAPLMARANKIIAAALQADPDAGVFHPQDCKFGLLLEGERWTSSSFWSGSYPVYMHTLEQAKEAARILNAEGIK